MFDPQGEPLQPDRPFSVPNELFMSISTAHEEIAIPIFSTLCYFRLNFSDFY
jgi:hypothetical protein